MCVIFNMHGDLVPRSKSHSTHLTSLNYFHLKISALSDRQVKAILNSPRRDSARALRESGHCLVAASFFFMAKIPLWTGTAPVFVHGAQFV